MKTDARRGGEGMRQREPGKMQGEGGQLRRGWCKERGTMQEEGGGARRGSDARRGWCVEAGAVRAGDSARRGGMMPGEGDNSRRRE